MSKKSNKTAVRGRPVSPCSAWVDVLDAPLADVVNGEYVVLPGREKLRLFAFRLRSGCYEIRLGRIDDDGCIVSDDHDDLGREVHDVDFYADVHEPND